MTATCIKRHALMPYTPEQMFAVVNDVAAYAGFLPGCSASAVLEETPDSMLARIELRRGPFRQAFTTRNRLERPDSIRMELQEGPFRRLDGEWRFTAIGGLGCRIELELEFELKDGVTQRLLGALFSQVADSLVESFCQRADALYR